MAFDPLTAVLEIGGKVLDKFVTDPGQKAAEQLELIKLAQSGTFKTLDLIANTDTNQANINLEEAKSDSIFKSGWRPFIGWCCGAGFGYQVVMLPLLTAFLPQYHFPPIDSNTLFAILPALLGIAGLRTYERVRAIDAR